MSRLQNIKPDLRNALTEIMNEHIRMPGFPQIIVTRGFCYRWLKSLGWSESERGFGSLDYIVFARKAVELPLVEEQTRDSWLSEVADDYRREVLPC